MGSPSPCRPDPRGLQSESFSRRGGTFPSSTSGARGRKTGRTEGAAVPGAGCRAVQADSSQAASCRFLMGRLGSFLLSFFDNFEGNWVLKKSFGHLN